MGCDGNDFITLLVVVRLSGHGEPNWQKGRVTSSLGSGGLRAVIPRSDPTVPDLTVLLLLSLLYFVHGRR